MRNSHRSKVNRLPSRGYYDKETINQIIDEALYCHVSFVHNNQPYIIPTIHARMADRIVLHGAKGSRMLKHLAERNEVCIAFTLMDGLVLARSVFHHSMNYRSVVLFGKGKLIENKVEKLEALKTITEHLILGRWDDARQPNEKELNATTVVSINIDEASAKIRTGPPIDDEEDYKLPVWAGLIPISQKYDSPENDPKLNEEIALPNYIREKII
jgi:nitroimidazol reductase NimA-like FMN-containing flavoprotein (pyridoxamine 5'-phosphate oxidase superfamily)